jgi:hypothetical protein
VLVFGLQVLDAQGGPNERFRERRELLADALPKLPFKFHLLERALLRLAFLGAGPVVCHREN